jgi:hypothetical protein
MLIIEKKWTEENSTKLILRDQDYYDTKTRQGHNKKESHRPISLVTIDAKIIYKLSANWIEQHIEKIIHCDQKRLIPTKQRQTALQINACDTQKQNEKHKDMIIQIDAEKHLRKSNIPSWYSKIPNSELIMYKRKVPQYNKYYL